MKMLRHAVSTLLSGLALAAAWGACAGTGPTGLTATAVATNGFTVAWDPVADATAYLVTVVTNGIVPAREGEVLWRETFPRVTQVERSDEYSLERLNPLTDWATWRGENLYSCTSTGHVVQVGNTSYRGTFATGPLRLEGTGRILKFCGWRSEGKNMPFEVVDSAGRTNLLTDVLLGATPACHRVELPTLASGDGIVFHSTTNAQRGRVYLGEMRILAGDEPERTNVLTVVENYAAAGCTASFGNLLPTVAFVRVASVVAGVTNASDWLEVDLANAEAGTWRVSQFKGGIREESCGWVTNVSQKTAWENGVTVPGFHAFLDEGEITQIYYDSGKLKVAGIYASTTNVADACFHALSLHASEDHEVALELRIVNDSPTRKTLSEAELTFTAHQGSFPAKGERWLRTEWAVAEEATWPGAGDWTAGDEASDLVSVDALGAGEAHRAVARILRTGRVLVSVGGRLCFRWRVPRAANSPFFGISDVRVRLMFLKDPFVLYFR